MRKTKINRAESKNGSAVYDQCQTPAYALDPLWRYLPSRNPMLWECAAGEGSLSIALRERGYRVTATDILSGMDFFGAEPAWWDMILTNPPGSIKYKWLARCYELGKPFALLMPVDVLGAKSAQTLFRAYGVEIIFMDKRINYKMPNLGYNGKGADFSSAWFTWQLGIGSPMTFATITTKPSLPACPTKAAGSGLRKAT